jgi:hypothetical protein
MRAPFARPAGESVSDIFNEIDEEVRRERLKKLWERYGHFVVVAAVVLVMGIGGWRGYEWWGARKAAEAGVAFEAATVLSDQGKHAEAETAFAKLAVEGNAGYRTLARFREASELAKRDAKAAVKLYDELAADRGIGQVMQDLAAVRAAFLLVDNASVDELRHRLEAPSEPRRAFRHTAREVLALGAWRAGNATEARRWFDMILTDADTPSGTRSRIEILMALVAADAKG